MAKKTGKKESEFDKLARLIKSESEDIRKEMATRNDMATGFASIRKKMPTKEDIAGIMVELRDIKARLKAVEEVVEEHSNYSKEIDHAFERIAAIEKRIGIAKH